MREVLNKGYSYSVLDCNGFVKAVQRASGYGMYTRQLAYDSTDLENLVEFDKWRAKQNKAKDVSSDNA